LRNINLLFFAIGWLILTPIASFADDVIVELTPETPYVDFVVNVDTTTAYAIHTNTGPRTEVIDSQTVVRTDWVDSWITLYRGVASDSGTVIRHDDDSNHNAENNFLASKLIGTLEADTYTIRATSFNYMANGSTPTGSYTLSSNLINLPETNTATASPDTATVNTSPSAQDTNTVTVDTGTVTTNPSNVDGTTATTNPPTNSTSTEQPVTPTPSPSPESQPEPIILPSPTPIEIDTSQEPSPMTPEQEPDTPITDTLDAEESLLDDEPVPEELLEQPTQELEQENLLEEPIETPIEDSEEPTSVFEENQEPVTSEDVDNLVESLNQDGELSQADVELIAEALLEEANGEPISAETLTNAGITYEDLPPATPVEIRQDENGNAVVITAEVAAALLVLESPVELLSGIFNDPAEVFMALGNIGADMSDAERAESEQTIVAAVIVSGIAVQATATAAIAGSATYRRRL